jgi:anti-sigma factor RsiW
MMDQQNCHRLLDSLSDYIDGTLGEELCEEIDKHLEDCKDCQIVVDSLRKTIYLYHTTSKPPSVPKDVRLRLYRRLNLSDFLDKAKDW